MQEGACRDIFMRMLDPRASTRDSNNKRVTEHISQSDVYIFTVHEHFLPFRNVSIQNTQIYGKVTAVRNVVFSTSSRDKVKRPF